MLFERSEEGDGVEPLTLARHPGFQDQFPAARGHLPIGYLVVAPRVGVEPTATRVTTARSTAELPRTDDLAGDEALESSSRALQARA